MTTTQILFNWGNRIYGQGKTKSIWEATKEKLNNLKELYLGKSH